MTIVGVELPVDELNHQLAEKYFIIYHDFTLDKYVLDELGAWSYLVKDGFHLTLHSYRRRKGDGQLPNSSLTLEVNEPDNHVLRVSMWLRNKLDLNLPAATQVFDVDTQTDEVIWIVPTVFLFKLRFVRPDKTVLMPL